MHKGLRSLYTPGCGYSGCLNLTSIMLFIDAAGAKPANQTNNNSPPVRMYVCTYFHICLYECMWVRMCTIICVCVCQARQTSCSQTVVQSFIVFLMFLHKEFQKCASIKLWPHAMQLGAYRCLVSFCIVTAL